MSVDTNPNGGHPDQPTVTPIPVRKLDPQLLAEHVADGHVTEDD